MNHYLLFFPSLLTERSKYGRYKVDNWETEYEGLQTNEPITKYLIHYLAEKGESIKQIIMLSTHAVRENKLQIIDERTTLNYYKESIMKYINENNYKHLYNVSEEQLFKVIEVNEEEGNSVEKILEPLKQIVKVTAENEKIEKNHIYVDFTGGLRTAALTMLFACRILQSYGGVVEKILYSNLGEQRITECTKTYYCFDYLAAQVEQKYNGTEQTLEYLKRELNADEEVKQFLEMLRQFEYDKKANNVEEAEEKAERLLEGISKVSGRTGDKTLANQMLENFSKNILDLKESKSGILYLLEEALEKKKYDQALRLFREQVFSMLVDLNILEIQNDYLKDKKNRQQLVNTMVGIYNYYEPIKKKEDAFKGKNNSNEKVRYTFIERVETFMDLLVEEKQREPKWIKNDFEKKYYSLRTYLDCVPKRGFRHNEYSRRECRKKLEQYMWRMEQEGKSLKECIEEYDKLERIYLGIGYPFLCTYNETIIGGYDTLYKKEVFNKGVGSIQKLYEGKIDETMQKVLDKLGVSSITYMEFLDIYVERKQEICILLFPFMLSDRDFKSDILGNEFAGFMYQFMKAFCYAKDVRNRMVHAHVKEEELEDVAKELRMVLENIKRVLEENHMQQEMITYYKK